MNLSLVIPGSIAQLTGGYLFARHVVEGLAQRGQPLTVIELAGHFPDADDAARESAQAALACLPDGAAAVIDGLGLAAFAHCLAREARRLRLLAWVHHALAAETGLSAVEAARFAAIERALLPLFRGAICPSRHTAAALIDYGVAPSRIGVVPPGTLKPARLTARPIKQGVLRLLTVATVTPRKGHLVLVEALASLRRDDWTLLCIGSLSRDPAHVAAVRRAIAARGLEARITLNDEIAQESLGAAYDAGDLFVLPSFLEGYGMAFAEALAHGLPIIGTNAGAIPDTVPASAGILVPPNDAPALAAALRFLLDDRPRLAQLAQGAAQSGAALPDWKQTAAAWQRAVEGLLA